MRNPKKSKGSKKSKGGDAGGPSLMAMDQGAAAAAAAGGGDAPAVSLLKPLPMVKSSSKQHQQQC